MVEKNDEGGSPGTDESSEAPKYVFRDISTITDEEMEELLREDLPPPELFKRKIEDTDPKPIELDPADFATQVLISTQS